MTEHKAAAEKAIHGVIEALAKPEPIDGLRRFQLKGACEFALEEVKAIQELKRRRPSKAGE